MTPTATGRHCAACDREVVDFSQMTDAELLAYFAQLRGQQVCGRIQPDRIARPLRVGPPAAPAWPRWVFAMLALLGLREAGGLPVQAQQETRPTAGPPRPPAEVKPLPAPAPENQPRARTLRGRVVDEDRQPIDEADVLLRSDDGQVLAHAVTDKAGRFILSRIARDSVAHLTLQVVSLRAHLYSRPIIARDLEQGFGCIQLKSTVTGGISYELPLYRRVWWKVKAVITWLFRRKAAE